MSYDESGRPFMITYANVSYYYLLNAQGDVVGIMNVSGDIMVEYTYDAWGNVLSITGPMADTMGQHNQLRYRGYVYDPETELYFLNSRFYNPETGRFINADVYPSTGQGLTGNNMFAYCGNNPIVRRDDGGAFWEIIVGAALGGAIAGALIGAVSYIVDCGISGTDVSASGLIGAVVTGAATGTVGAIGGVVPGADVIASVSVGFIVGVTTGINTEGSTSERIATGFAAGVLAAGGTYLGTKIPIAKDTAFTTGVTAFAGGLFMGAQTEIVNVATQHAISNMFDGKNSSKSSSGQLNRGYVYQIFGGC